MPTFRTAVSTFAVQSTRAVGGTGPGSVDTAGGVFGRFARDTRVRDTSAFAYKTEQGQQAPLAELRYASTAVGTPVVTNPASSTGAPDGTSATLTFDLAGDAGAFTWGFGPAPFANLPTNTQLIDLQVTVKGTLDAGAVTFSTRNLLTNQTLPAAPAPDDTFGTQRFDMSGQSIGSLFGNLIEFDFTATSGASQASVDSVSIVLQYVLPAAPNYLGSAGFTGSGSLAATGSMLAVGTASLGAGGQATTGARYRDDFNRADGPLGANWVTSSFLPANAVSVGSNTLRGGPSAQHVRYAAPVTGPQFSEMTSTGLEAVGPAVGMNAFGAGDNIDSYALLPASQGKIELVRRTEGPGGGTFAVGVVNQLIQAGDVMRLEWDGATVRALINGIEVISAVNSDLSIATHSYVGVAQTRASPQGYPSTVAIGDDWSGGTVTPAPVPAVVQSVGFSGTGTLTAVDTSPRPVHQFVDTMSTTANWHFDSGDYFASDGDAIRATVPASLDPATAKYPYTETQFLPAGSWFLFKVSAIQSAGDWVVWLTNLDPNGAGVDKYTIGFNFTSTGTFVRTGNGTSGVDFATDKWFLCSLDAAAARISFYGSTDGTTWKHRFSTAATVGSGGTYSAPGAFYIQPRSGRASGDFIEISEFNTGYTKLPWDATPSGSGTLTATGTALGAGNFTGTAALSGSGTLTTAGVPKPIQTVALSGSGTTTTAVIPTPIQSVTLTGSGTDAASVRAGLFGTVDLSGSGTPTAVGVMAVTGATAAPTGSGTLAVTGKVLTTAAPSGSGTLTTAGKPAVPVAVPATGSGTLAVTAAVVVASVSLSGSGALSALTNSKADLTGSGTLAATGAPTIPGTAALSGDGALTAAGVPGYVDFAFFNGSLYDTPNLRAGTGDDPSAPGFSAGTPNLITAATAAGDGEITGPRLHPELVAPYGDEHSLRLLDVVVSPGSSYYIEVDLLPEPDYDGRPFHLAQFSAVSQRTDLNPFDSAEESFWWWWAEPVGVSDYLNEPFTLRMFITPGGANYDDAVAQGELGVLLAFSLAAGVTIVDVRWTSVEPVGVPHIPTTSSTSGSGLLEATGAQGVTRSVALSGDSLLVATATLAGSGFAILGGSSSLTTTSIPGLTGTAHPSGAGATSTSDPLIIASATTSPTGTGTLGAAPLVNLTGSASSSGSGSLAAVGVPRVAVTTLGAGSGTTATSAPIPTLVQSVAPSGSGALTASGKPAVASSVALDGLGGLGASTVTGLPGFSVAVAVTGSGNLVAAGSTTGSTGTGGFFGSGTLTATGAAKITGATAAPNGAGAATAAGTPAASTMGTPTGSGTLTVTPHLAFDGTAATDGTGQLAAAGTPILTTSTSLTGSGTITTTVVPRTGVQVAVSGPGALSASGAPTMTAVASLDAEGFLYTTVVTGSSGQADFAATGSLSARGFDSVREITARVSLLRTGWLADAALASPKATLQVANQKATARLNTPRAVPRRAWTSRSHLEH